MKKLVLLSIALLALSGACTTASRPAASATLTPSAGSLASGTVDFVQMPEGVQVSIRLAGVPPGIHGFHVHEKGDCGNNGGAAGMHFNPTSAPHGGPADASRHAGDFGNVEADANGEVTDTRMLLGITVVAGPTSVVGRAVILHADPDDLKTQPTGNAGGRIACGVVQQQ